MTPQIDIHFMVPTWKRMRKAVRKRMRMMGRKEEDESREAVLVRTTTGHKSRKYVHKISRFALD